jgi:hypothetical protein
MYQQHGEVKMNSQLNSIREVWASVEGYEGLYEVSTQGRIRSSDRVSSFGKQKKLWKGQILTPRVSAHGYLRCHLAKDGKIREFYIHRLVAMTFLKNPENKLEINHLDEVKTNNSIDNLAWATRTENARWSMKSNREARLNQINVV